MTMRERLPAQPPDSVDLSATLELLASLRQYAEAGAVQPHTLAQAAQHALEQHGDHIEVLVAVSKLYVAIDDRASAAQVLGRALRVAPEDKRVAQLLADAGLEQEPTGLQTMKPRSAVQPTAREARQAPPSVRTPEIDTRVRKRELARAEPEVAPPSSRTPVSLRGSQIAKATRTGSVTVEEAPRKLDTAPPSTPRSAGAEGPILRPTVRMARVHQAPPERADRSRWTKSDPDARADREPLSEGQRVTRPDPGASTPFLAKMGREAIAGTGPSKSNRAATGNLKLLDPNDERRHLDRYELIGEIASGGMATVYLARLAGVAGFQRFFAIKRLHPHLADEQEFIDMFLDEARLAAGIHHPNVVPILEVGTSEAGYYLVMDYIEGDTLSGVTNRANAGGGLPRPIALRILVDSLHGLHAAHELTDADGRPVELVHRDCSPQNILVGVDGSSRITDFGVARASSRLSTTRSATVKGKLAYLSPEQATGRGLDRRSDLFGMGVILWEAFAGRRLFRADSDGATLSRILVEPIPSLAEFAPDLPPTVLQVVSTALARDPNDRFATGTDLADALERAVRDADVTGLYVASPREVASFMRELFGADVAARRDAIRAWSQQATEPAASGPRSQGLRRYDLSPPPSSARGGLPSSVSGQALLAAKEARHAKRSPASEGRPSLSRDTAPATVRDDHGDTLDSENHDAEYDEEVDSSEDPPSSKTEPSAVHSEEAPAATRPPVTIGQAPPEPASTRGVPLSSRAILPLEPVADPAAAAAEAPIDATAPAEAVRFEGGGRDAAPADQRLATRAEKRPPILVIVITVALIAAALTAFLMRR